LVKDVDRVVVAPDPDRDGPPVMLTYHVSALGNPDSVNDTEYVTGANGKLMPSAAPLTVNEGL
jgi:hypothetical protein